MPIDARWLRKTVGPWLPESAKASFRSRLFGYSEPRGHLAARLHSDGQGRFALIDERITIRYRDEDQGDFAYQFLENGDSVDEMAAFLRAAEHARTFVDVGAWKGIFSLLFCLMRPGNRAIAYEPSPAGRASIACLAASNRLTALEVRPVAVGAAARSKPGRLAPNGTFAIESDESAGELIGSVETVSLDDDLKSLGVVPELLKIDVEGYEHEVLVGARHVLARHKPIISLELHLDVLERRGVRPLTVVDELTAHGYRFERPTGEPLTPNQICGSPLAILRFVAK